VTAVATTRSAGPIAVLTDGLALVARASRVLRRASLYVGVLFVALAGAGIVAELGIQSWAESFVPSTDRAYRTAVEAADRASTLLVIGLAGCLAVIIDGGAIGMTLLAGRILGVEVSLADAIRRARQVFWRLVGVITVTAIAEVVLSLVYRALIRAPAVNGPVDLPVVMIEPIPSLVVTIPFVLATASVVLADDGVRAAFRRSFGLIRRARRLGVALALFALLSGVIEGFALGSGFDLLLRITGALNLDVASGAAGFVGSALVGLAIVMAVGSLVFTVAALVAAPQVIALIRLGVPLDGLARVVRSPATEPAMDSATEKDIGPLVAAPVDPPVDPPVAPTVAPPGAPPVAPPGAPPLAPKPQLVRWVTIPMRLMALGLWIVALSSVLVGPPS